jgi:hypothetical protein
MGVMKNIEDEYIILPLQSALPPSCKEGLCNDIISLPLILLNPFTTSGLMICLYFCGDSLLAFKGAIVSCVGLYMLVFSNMFYKDGRPFWHSAEIVPYGHCKFTFSSPAENSFISTFFMTYILINMRMKYALTGNPNKIVNGILIFIIVLLTLWSFVNGVVNGLTYIY